MIPQVVCPFSSFRPWTARVGVLVEEAAFVANHSGPNPLISLDGLPRRAISAAVCIDNPVSPS